jgi:hypothetical protein
MTDGPGDVEGTQGVARSSMPGGEGSYVPKPTCTFPLFEPTQQGGNSL